MSVPIESPYATSMTSYLVQFRSYRRLFFKFWTLCIFEPPFFFCGGGGLKVTYTVYLWKARSGLPIRVHRTSSLRRYERISIKNRSFRSNTASLVHNFRYKRSSPTTNSLCRKTRINVLSCDIRM